MVAPTPRTVAAGELLGSRSAGSGAADAATRLPSGRWRRLAAPSGPPTPLRGLDAAWDAVVACAVPWVPRRRRCLRRAERVLALAAGLEALPTAELAEQTRAVAERFRLGRDTAADLDLAFAVVREQATRVLGLRAYPVQVAAAIAMERGAIAEVATGEGKTLIATMPAVLAGWRGRGCHVLTANDYLAARDAEKMRPVYEACGLTVASVVDATPQEARTAAYAAGVTYTTNKEAAADFLRDRIVAGRDACLADGLLRELVRGAGLGSGRGVAGVQRGLEHAIVDEADAVLIDEGTTPLIISGEAPSPGREQAHREAVGHADAFSRGRDYRVDERFREVVMTPAGRARVARLAGTSSGIWSGRRRAEELLNQAITARELYLAGRDYVVQDGRVVIVDAFNGRLMPDRSWSDGLHQAVEAKERLALSPPRETLARISFQRFFRHYRHLSGMTGTAREERRELWKTYRCPVVALPTHRRPQRRDQGIRITRSRDSRIAEVVRDTQEKRSVGRPVLIGTRSVAESERLSEGLEAAGIPHRVLNAVRHGEEAAVVAGAGEVGRVTLATNMAGRGTDIALGEGVAELGGLHVIVCGMNDARRVDRQLFGRAARQGEPGSAVMVCSLQDGLPVQHAPRVVRATLGRLFPRGVLRLAQRRAQNRARSQRAGVLKRDRWLAESLGFAGIE
ncbi:protein translocase subunit SecA [Phycisphaera mikurensis NBRC 102666]|uniref:Protein translocase subunit SecA n=1 Tax=Phycisphaera mikurensis (strain NBRC 102666 / KCTC 22515 / FYK2301M01) TaxID=1142394 RepID=I0IEX2_PHYMF|nr:protein translocase subunit SecA [Phycisphaera mikurensis NBRC 102666]